MGQDRSKNVIELRPYRQRRLANFDHTIFYVSETGRCLEALGAFPSLAVEDIRSEAVLKSKLLACNPELIFVESELSWTDPLETVKRLDYLLEVPIVLICPRRRGVPPEFMKKAYAAGICDTLFAPLKKDELAETLGVLLKFQIQVSLNQ